MDIHIVQTFRRQTDREGDKSGLTSAYCCYVHRTMGTNDDKWTGLIKEQDMSLRTKMPPMDVFGMYGFHATRRVLSLLSGMEASGQHATCYCCWHHRFGVRPGIVNLAVLVVNANFYYHKVPLIWFI